MLAKYSGICPLCSTYVAKGQSPIERLPEALAPRGNGHMSFDDGDYYNARGTPIDRPHAPREWAHERCATRYLKAQNRDPDETGCSCRAKTRVFSNNREGTRYTVKLHTYHCPSQDEVDGQRRSAPAA